MKIAVVYLRVLIRAYNQPMPFSYEAGHDRFLKSYLRHRPAIPHDLIVVNCGHGHWDRGPYATSTQFDDLTDSFRCYDGNGSDCGTYQHIAPTLDYDLCFFLNTLAYFWRDGWMEPFLNAFRQHGPGVYGVTSSMERSSHLRTPAIACSPGLLSKYPVVVSNRDLTYRFESGADNFSIWAESAGYPCRLVAADGIYRRSEWRKPANIFRRGDQSNCLIWDRHTLLYSESPPDQKHYLECLANGA